jgi:hypothetical protein
MQMFQDEQRSMILGFANLSAMPFLVTTRHFLIRWRLVFGGFAGCGCLLFG